MDVEAALRADQRGQETDRAGAGDKQRLRLKTARAAADTLGRDLQDAALPHARTRGARWKA